MKFLGVEMQATEIEPTLLVITTIHPTNYQSFTTSRVQPRSITVSQLNLGQNRNDGE